MSDTGSEPHDEDITDTRLDDTTMTAGSDDYTFASAEDFVVNGDEDEEADHTEHTIGLRDDTRTSGILAETDAIDDTELLIGSTPARNARRTPLGTPIRKTPARARFAGNTPGSRSALSRNRTPMRMTPKRVPASPSTSTPFRGTPGNSGRSGRIPLSTPRVLGTRVGEVTPNDVRRNDDDENEDDLGGAARFLEEFNLRHYKAGNPFTGSDDTQGADDHDDGDLTFSHVTFWGKDVPDREELEALKNAKELNNASARLIQRLVCTNAIQRRFIRQQNNGWADLADAEREEDHRRVSSVQKAQAKAIEKLNEKRVTLMEQLAMEKGRNAELISDLESKDRDILNFKTSICENEEVEASDIDTDEALALLDEQSKGLKLASDRLGDLEEHNQQLMMHQGAIVEVVNKIGRSTNVEAAVATISDFVERARDTVDDIAKYDGQGQGVKEEDIEAIYALAQSVGYEAGETASLPDAVEALWSFVDEAKQTESTLRRSPRTPSSLLRGVEGSPSAIDDVSKQTLQHELNVRTAELDTFAAYANELEPELDPVASAKDILDLFRIRIGRVSEERVNELVNEVREYEELYNAQNVRVSSLEDSFEKAQARITSLEQILSKERKTHDDAIREMESNTQNAVADLEKHALLLTDRDSELLALQEEFAFFKKLNEKNGTVPDNATMVRLELTNKNLVAKCSEFEKSLCFWKDRATGGAEKLVNRPQSRYDGEMNAENSSTLRHSIGTGGYTALAKRIEVLSAERSSYMEKIKQLKQDLQSHESAITEMRKEFASERDTLQKLLNHANIELEDLREGLKDGQDEQSRMHQDFLSEDDTVDDHTTRLSLKITDIINSSSWDDKSIEAAIHSLDDLVGVKDNFVQRTKELVGRLKTLGEGRTPENRKERTLLTIDSRTTLEKFAAVFKIQQNLIELLRGRTWSSIRRLSRAAAVSGDPTLTSELDSTLPPSGMSPLRSPVIEKDNTLPYGSGTKHAMRAQRSMRPVMRSSIDRASSANKTFEYMKVQLDETRTLLKVQEKEAQSLRDMIAKTESENLHLQEERVEMRNTMNKVRESAETFLERLASIASVDPNRNAIERFCITAVAEKETLEKMVCLQVSLERKASSLLVQKAILLQAINVFQNNYGVSIFGKHKPKRLKSLVRSVIWVNRLSALAATSPRGDDQNLLVAASVLYQVPTFVTVTLDLREAPEMDDLFLAYRTVPSLENRLRSREAKIEDTTKALTLLENTSPLEYQGISPVRGNGQDYNQDIMKRKRELAALLEHKIDDISQRYNEEYKLRVAAESNIGSYVRKINSLRKKLDKVKARSGRRELTYKAAIKLLKEKADAASSNPVDETVVYAFNEAMQNISGGKEREKVVVYNEGQKENDDEAVKLLEKQIAQLRVEAQSISADPWLKQQSKEYINGMTRAIRKIKRFAEKHENRDKEGDSKDTELAPRRELSASP